MKKIHTVTSNKVLHVKYLTPRGTWAVFWAQEEWEVSASLRFTGCRTTRTISLETGEACAFAVRLNNIRLQARIKPRIEECERPEWWDRTRDDAEVSLGDSQIFPHDFRIATVVDFLAMFEGFTPSVEDFVRLNGRSMPYRALPKNITPGSKKECIKNCYDLMVLCPQKYIYCEGYARGDLPVQHAWLIDEAGFVVDPTWEEPTPSESREYYGIPFCIDYIHKVKARTGCHGILNNDHNWRENLALPRATFYEFRSETSYV
jgi:hypothetical protein